MLHFVNSYPNLMKAKNPFMITNFQWILWIVPGRTSAIRTAQSNRTLELASGLRVKLKKPHIPGMDCCLYLCGCF
jgi:hypothetical protein